MFVADHQSSEAVQPADRAFNLPTIAIPLQLVWVLRGRLRAVVTMRADQLDEPVLQSSPQRVAVGSLIVQQASRGPEGLIDHRAVQQWFDESELAVVGPGDVTGQRNVIRIGQQQQGGAFAFASATDAWPPFFAGENEPSASRCLHWMQ